MEYALFCGIILFVIVIYFVIGYFNNKKQEKLFIQTLRKNYGLYPNKEYQSEQFESISHYFEKCGDKGNCIDDITWNDLDMDRVFMSMNHTYSSAGEEYLYYLLRTPKLEEAWLNAFEEKVTHFAQAEEERIKLQVLFKKLGKTGKFSLMDYLDYLDMLGVRKNTKHILVDLLFIPAILVIPFSSSVGIVSLLALLGYNITTYFKEKGEIEPYLTSFSYILRLLSCVDELKKLKTESIEEEKKTLLNYRKQMNEFSKNSFVAMQSMGGNSGNPIEIVLDYLRMFLHLDIIKFNSMLAVVNKNRETIKEIVGVLGYIEASISVGAYRASLPYYSIPHFMEDKRLEVTGIYHPLIANPVVNDIFTTQGVLLTGSNASGKSTFLKAVAINAILAQTIHTSVTKEMYTSFYRIFSSMALRDDLSAGESYYIVEIKSLKRILDETEKDGKPVLCFVDEVLRGTNTVERIAASTQILKSLSGDNVICFAATHDIELTHLLEDLYTNYHFTEEVKNNDVIFSYKLLSGRATTRNAIKLLEVMGYEKNIIEQASQMANIFLEKGIWN